MALGSKSDLISRGGDQRATESERGSEQQAGKQASKGAAAAAATAALVTRAKRRRTGEIRAGGDVTQLLIKTPYDVIV